MNSGKWRGVWRNREVSGGFDGLEELRSRGYGG